MKNQLPVLLFVLLGGCETQLEKAAAPLPSAPKPSTREHAIEAGLAWLARHQSPDGSWRARAVDADCNRSVDPGNPKIEWTDHSDVGSTALESAAAAQPVIETSES